MKNHFFLLRKHVDRQAYSTRGLEVLKHCCGTVIAYVDGGYFLNLTAVPKDPKRPASSLSSKDSYTTAALETLNEVVEHFRYLLSVLQPADMRRPSVVKQGLTKTTTFKVLF